jgi:2,4-dienoyl-CoA reductase (NADPH2)
MSDNLHFPHLFSPLRLGERTLRNRIALAATLTNYGAAHRVTERWIDFLAERAKGGCGMIASEIIAVDPAALAHRAIIAGFAEENEDGFKRTAAAVAGAGACLPRPTAATGGRRYAPGRRLPCAAQSLVRHTRRRSRRNGDLKISRTGGISGRPSGHR